MTENNNHNKDARTNDDDILLEQFFQAARVEQLADNGFSHRVMMRLPERQQRLSQIWTWGCVIVAVAVFIFIGGGQQVAAGIIRVLSSVHTTTQLLQLMVCGAVLTTLAAIEVMRRERFIMR